MTLMGVPEVLGNPSNPEQDFIHRLAQYILGEEAEPNNKTILDGLEIDIWFPTINLGIEWQGHPSHWYDTMGYRDNKVNDARKRVLAKEKGITLLQLKRKVLDHGNPYGNMVRILRDYGYQTNQLTLDIPPDAGKLLQTGGRP